MSATGSLIVWTVTTLTNPDVSGLFSTLIFLSKIIIEKFEVFEYIRGKEETFFIFPSSKLEGYSKINILPL